MYRRGRVPSEPTSELESASHEAVVPKCLIRFAPACVVRLHDLPWNPRIIGKEKNGLGFLDIFQRAPQLSREELFGKLFTKQREFCGRIRRDERITAGVFATVKFLEGLENFSLPKFRPMKSPSRKWSIGKVEPPIWGVEDVVEPEKISIALSGDTDLQVSG